MDLTFQKLPGWVEHLHHGVHDFSAHQLRIALSNTAPGAEATPVNGPAADCILGNVTEIDYTNLGSRAVTTVSSGQSGGTYRLHLQDLTVTASGGPVGPWRYIYLYNDTPASPADPLIGYWDRGQSETLQDGDPLVLDFSEINGLFGTT